MWSFFMKGIRNNYLLQDAKAAVELEDSGRAVQTEPKDFDAIVEA
jgi:hypothetical protein